MMEAAAIDNNNISTKDDDDDDETWVGFKGEMWQVHKFGGTSVANADCYRAAATIVEEQLGISSSDNNNNHNDHHHHAYDNDNQVHLSVVVSAMGGKPKVTDLLLQSVEGAANRNYEQVDNALNLVLQKHNDCLTDLFDDSKNDREELMQIVQKDITDIRTILQTVSLMKWQAKRISELVSGYGELWSSQILTRKLHNRSIERLQHHNNNNNDSSSSLHPEEFVFHEFVYVDARRIITIDEEAIEGGAIQWELSQSNLNKVYEEELAKLSTASTTKATAAAITTRMHMVVTGYVCSNTEGVPTTLQRDGSDFSAAIMGRLLQSTNVTIWTDVDGVLSADPRRVPAAEAVPDVSYNEAMELAYFGAKVIHPKTMQPAISSHPQIPIYIRNTFNSKFRGSRIHTASVTNTSPDQCVCGFSTIENMALINVEGSGLMGVQGVAKRLFGTLESLGINVVLISQASSEHTITFATVAEQAEKAREAVYNEFERELKNLKISNVDVTAPCSIIAAVGEGMMHVAGVAGRFFSALGDARINCICISQGSSERNISAVISSADSTRALRALHSAFHLSHTTVRVGIIGGGINIGESLLRLLEAERRKIRFAFEIDLQVCVVAMGSRDTDIYQLKNEAGEDSITASAIIGYTLSDEPTKISFAGKFNDGEISTGIVMSTTNDCSTILDTLVREDCANHVIFDCTSDDEASEFHPQWLSAGVHVVTANHMGLSGPKKLRDSIELASTRLGRLSAQYLHEVTVAGGLPIISTIRTLLTSGDKIRRVDGIFSLSLSYIMYRISPPDECDRLGEFDKELTKGAFKGNISLAGTALGTPCLFSQAVKEAVSLGLMENDPTLDLRNEYTSRTMMVLAKELGLDRNISYQEIQSRSDVIAEIPPNVEERDYRLFEGATDEKIKERVHLASERGCVLRHIASIDVVSQCIDIKIVEVPKNHDFAIAHPTSVCVRLHTQRYQPYPLQIAGPAAGADCTSSALLAELLSLMSTKIGPKSGVLSRTNSGTHLS